jgi:hypothetical protein
MSVLIATIGPCSWTKIQSVSISIPIPPETDGVFVYLCKGDNFPESPAVQFSQGTSTLGNYYGDWGLFRGRLVVHTPPLRGSRLFGLLSWTKRRLMATGFEPTVRSPCSRLLSTAHVGLLGVVHPRGHWVATTSVHLHGRDKHVSTNSATSW